MQLWLGVCPESSADRSRIFDAQFPLMGIEQQNRFVEMGEQAYLDDCMQRAVEVISTEPWRFARLTGIRALDYWAGTVFSHQPPGGSGWPASPLRAAGAVFLFFEAVVAAGGLIFLKKTPVAARWLLGIVVAFSLVYCLTHVEIRYRTPCEPVLALVVGILLSSLWQGLRRNFNREVPAGTDSPCEGV
jgi:hypothetical protein